MVAVPTELRVVSETKINDSADSPPEPEVLAHGLRRTLHQLGRAAVGGYDTEPHLPKLHPPEQPPTPVGSGSREVGRYFTRPESGRAATAVKMSSL